MNASTMYINCKQLCLAIFYVDYFFFFFSLGRGKGELVKKYKEKE